MAAANEDILTGALRTAVETADREEREQTREEAPFGGTRWSIKTREMATDKRTLPLVGNPYQTL